LQRPSLESHTITMQPASGSRWQPLTSSLHTHVPLGTPAGTTQCAHPPSLPARPPARPPACLQTYIDAPNAASGPIPDDVSPFFEGPYFEW
jgi:hypothetical protein